MNRLQAAEKRYANLKLLWQKRVKQTEELEAQNAQLRKALEKCRTAINSLPEDALGTGHVEQGGDSYAYPLRDELLDKVNKALAAASPAAEEGTK